MLEPCSFTKLYIYTHISPACPKENICNYIPRHPAFAVSVHPLPNAASLQHPPGPFRLAGHENPKHGRVRISYRWCQPRYKISGTPLKYLLKPPPPFLFFISFPFPSLPSPLSNLNRTHCKSHTYLTPREALLFFDPHHVQGIGCGCEAGSKGWGGWGWGWGLGGIDGWVGG